MARPKSVPSLEQRKVLGALEAVTASLVEADAERDRLIVEAHELEATGAQIAKAAGIGESTLYEVLKRVRQVSSS